MDLQIKYDNGQMNIRMDAFFPTSQARLKKLLKVVDLDFEHKDEIKQTMQQFFQDKVKEEEMLCIRFHMGAYVTGDWDAFDRAIRKYQSVLFTHTADMYASKVKDV